MSVDLFKEILPSVLTTKKSVLKEPSDEKSYVPFMVNRAIGMHRDLVFYANQMNQCPSLPKIAQYDFFLGSIRAMKRPYVPWPKKDADLKLIMEVFQYTREKAQAALYILTDSQLKEIRAAQEPVKSK